VSRDHCLPVQERRWPAACELLRLARNRNLDCVRATNQPDGQISKNLSSLPTKNIPLKPSGKSALSACPIPPHQEGRIMIVTNVGRDAVDAMARDRRTAPFADGEVVWF
jgi:hypothetical protein